MEEQIKQLEDRITLLEKAQNLDANSLLFETLFSDKGSYDATLNRSISLSGDPQSITVIENPTATLKLEYKGVKYRILLYPLD